MPGVPDGDEMPAKDLECQLAMLQLSRYMNDIALSDAALEDLESHLAECAECQAEVMRLRIAQLHEPEPAPTHAVVEEQQPTAAKPKAESRVAPAAAKLGILNRIHPNVRMGVLSLALAGVLMTMSSVAKDPSKVFGPRASDLARPTTVAGSVVRANPAKPTPVIAELPNATTPPPEKREEPKREDPPKAESAKPALTKSSPAPVKRRTTPRRPVRRPTTVAKRPTPTKSPTPAKPAPKPASRPKGGIIVYDEKGNRI